MNSSKFYKLLQINSVANYGSTGRIAEQIGKVAIMNGWESYIAYGRKAQTSNSNLLRIGNDRDLMSHLLITRLFDKHGFGSRNASLRLIDEISKINPHVIHLHNLHGYYINLEVLFNYLSRSGIKTFWTLYDCWAFTGHCTYYDLIKCDKWKTKCFSCPATKEYPKSWFYDNSSSNYELKKSLFNLQDLTIITNSKWLFNEVDESFLSKHNRVLINSGIDVSAFSPQEITEFKRKHELKNQFIILGVAKMWTKRKGLNDFYEISKLLKKDEIILLDGGIADPSNRKTPDNIKLLKPAKNIEELSVLYSSADVFINPTYEDNFPTTNLESLACGTPVITYDTGGSPEAVDSNTGMVVQKGNIVGLYDAISAIRKNGKAFYTNSCRERAENNFNANIKYNEYFKLFNQ